MKGILLGVFVFIILFYTAAAIWAYNNHKRKQHENEDNEEDRLLDGHGIPEEDLGFLCGEQPFFENYKWLN